MALKAKNDEEEGSFEDENQKFKAYITRQFKKFIKNANVKVSDKDRKKSGFPHPNFQNTSLGIQIWQQPFNPITFVSKVSKFSKYLSSDSDSATTV